MIEYKTRQGTGGMQTKWEILTVVRESAPCRTKGEKMSDEELKKEIMAIIMQQYPSKHDLVHKWAIVHDIIKSSVR